MSRRDTRTQPRALSEADELDLYLEKRDTWLSTEVRSSARQVRLLSSASRDPRHRSCPGMVSFRTAADFACACETVAYSSVRSRMPLKTESIDRS